MKPVLETERLKLIPFDMDDQDLLHRTFSDPFVRKFLWDDEVIDADQTKEILLLNKKQFDFKSWGLWKIQVKDGERYAGFVGLWTFFDEPQPQLLYGLLPDKTGLGYATEASKAIIAYAFTELRFSYLIAACDAPHEASKKVCDRLGMNLVEEKVINGKSTLFYRLDNRP